MPELPPLRPGSSWPRGRASRPREEGRRLEPPPPRGLAELSPQGPPGDGPGRQRWATAAAALAPFPDRHGCVQSAGLGPESAGNGQNASEGCSGVLRRKVLPDKKVRPILRIRLADPPQPNHAFVLFITILHNAIYVDKAPAGPRVKGPENLPRSATDCQFDGPAMP